jgi:hypothetical protein
MLWYQMKSKRHKKHKAHDKKHREAAARPVNHRVIRSLLKHWRNMTAVKRGDLILRLLKRGCTMRGLGRDLHVSARIVKLATDAAKLTLEYRTMIEQGASAKRVLSRANSNNNSSRRKLRLEQERKDGRHSTERANQYAWFVLTQIPDECFGYFRFDRYQEEIKERLFFVPLRGFDRCDALPGSGPEIGLRRAVELAWPPPTTKISLLHDTDDSLEDRFQAYINFMYIMESDKLIREDGLYKASKLLARLQLEGDEPEEVRKRADNVSPRALGKLLRQLPEYRYTRHLYPLLPKRDDLTRPPTAAPAAVRHQHPVRPAFARRHFSRRISTRNKASART